MSEQLILVEYLTSGVAKVILNNPPLNLVTLELTRQLSETLLALDSDEKVRVVVITGTGDRAFCAGSDIKEFPSVSDDVIGKKLKNENEAFRKIEFLSKPVIAAIEGIAYGGGCEMALACDLRVMAENAKIALPEIKLGVFPGSGGIYRLPKLVGPAKAMELMFLGSPISAAEAERIGLINRVSPAGKSLEMALSLAELVAQQAAQGIKAIKRGVRESLLQTHEEAVELTLELSHHVFQTEDCVEGVKAFMEKRSPQFRRIV